MIQSDREYMMEEEWLLVRHSGEIPEVALHASLHYLETESEGPKFILSQAEVQYLQQAALARYQEIILRDLDPSNRDLALFRGIRRAYHNWYRYVRFSEKIGCAVAPFRADVAAHLRHYLELEQEERRGGTARPPINCSADALLTFALALGIDAHTLPVGWQDLCEQSGL